MERRILRGDLYICDFGNDGKFGSEQKGVRPCIVISNNIANRFSTTITVAPITSKIKTEIPTHVSISMESGLFTDSTILLEQPYTVDKKLRIQRKIGTVSLEKMKEVDIAIRISMGLE